MSARFCCVILHDPDTDSLLLELRPPTAAAAANKLTCFGGKLEAFEDAPSCALRECREELGWAPPSGLAPAVDLYVGGELCAHFFLARAPSRDAPLRFEPGREGVWLTVAEARADPRLSPWHAAVLSAWQRGAARADHPSS